MIVPVVLGLNSRVIVQEALTASEVPQLVVPVKLELLSVMLLMVTVLELPLASVNVLLALVLPSASLPKFAVAGVSVTVPPAAAPVPDKLAVCGLFDALSVTVRVPVAAPVAVGLNVTLMLQELFAASEVPQVLVSAKTPLTAMLPIAMALEVPLFNVMVCAVLVVFTVTLPKLKLVGLSATVPVGVDAPARALMRFCPFGLPHPVTKS